MKAGITSLPQSRNTYSSLSLSTWFQPLARGYETIHTAQTTSPCLYMPECRAVALGSGGREVKHQQQAHPIRSVTKVGRLFCSACDLHPEVAALNFPALHPLEHLMRRGRHVSPDRWLLNSICFWDTSWRYVNLSRRAGGHPRVPGILPASMTQTVPVGICQQGFVP